MIETVELLDALDIQHNQIKQLSKLGVSVHQLTSDLEIAVIRQICVDIVGEYVHKSDRSHPKYSICREIESDIYKWLERKRDKPYISIELDGSDSKEMNRCEEFVNWLCKLHNDLLTT